jgi:hypothetical protein
MSGSERARHLVDVERQADYGHPRANMLRTAQMWRAVLGVDVTPEQVALCMVCVKLAREVHRHKQDNIDDAHGYLHVLEILEEGDAEGDAGV